MNKLYKYLLLLPVVLFLSGCADDRPGNIVFRDINESLDYYPFMYESGNWDYPDYTAGYTSPGNHRFVVKTGGTAEDFYRAVIPCRRVDTNPHEKKVIVIDALSGEEVPESHILKSDSETLDLVFRTSESDTYYIYFLPHTCSGGYYPKYQYLLQDETPLAEWLDNVGLSMDQLDDLPLSITISEQSIDDFHSFFPMEVIATREELNSYIERYPAAYYLFPEYRYYPIRMRKFLPFRWMREEAKGLNEKILRGEYYTFQTGIYSPTEDLGNIDIEYSGLSGNKGEIPPENFTCFNTEGVDLNGGHFTKSFSIEAGMVQALWFGVDIAETVKSGLYRGWVRIEPEGLPADTVYLALEVLDELAVDQGDNFPEKMSRMRWLNSKVGVDNDYIIEPFIPVAFSGKTMSILGRELSINDFGFPEDISSFFAQEMTFLQGRPEALLESAISMDIVDADNKVIELESSEYLVEKESKGALIWNVTNSSSNLRMELAGRLEYDGMLDYKIRIIADEDISLNDIRLAIPLKEEVAEYILGLGFIGRKLPDEVRWNWDIKKHQEGVWLGTINKGLQYVLRDENYERPLNTNFYQDKPLNLPPSWYNDGKGGINISRRNGVTLIDNYSGKRSVMAGDTLNFNIRFLITPFKTIDTKSHFNTRFVHKYIPVDSVAKLHGNIVNVHHANEINPYINYPFYNTEKQKAYIDEAHDKGIKVKLYNTIRELSYRAYELFALRSLGDEILNTGEGGGHSWLQEHLRSDYYSAWHATRVNDAAILNKGTSRWTNYYIEGINWLAKNQGMDGLYLDDIAFSRSTVKRIANVLSENRGSYVIDLHSANQFNNRDGFINSAFLYMEHFPYVSRLWFGEYFDYYADPDYWFTEVSGLPFGLTGEMLQDGGRPYHGLIYGMTTRVYGNYNPSEIWNLFDDFGISESRMLGYWVDSTPVTVINDKIKSTVYLKDKSIMIVLASWSDIEEEVSLELNWDELGLSSGNSSLYAPEIKGLQERKLMDPANPIFIKGNSGLILILEDQ